MTEIGNDMDKTNQKRLDIAARILASWISTDNKCVSLDRQVKTVNLSLDLADTLMRQNERYGARSVNKEVES